jgi:hypothetical protein
VNLLSAATPWDYAVFERASAPNNVARYSTAAGVRGLLVEDAANAGAVETLKIPISAFQTAQGSFEIVFSHAHAPATNGRIFTVGASSAAPFTDDCFLVRRNSTNAKQFQLLCYTSGSSTLVTVTATMTNDITTDRRYYLGITWDMAALTVTLSVRDLVSNEWVTTSGTLVSNAMSFADETHVWIGRGKSPTEVLGNLAIEELRLSGQDRSVASLLTASYQRLALDANTTCLLTVPVNGEALAVRWSDGKSVQLPTAAARPGSRSDQVRQIKTRDSAGNVYVYGKGLLRRVNHQMVWSRVSSTVKTRMETLLGTHAGGTRNPMVWIDHELASHTVRLDGGQAGFDPAGGGNWRASLGLFEEVA